MRRLIAAAAALAVMAGVSVAAEETPGWTYAYADGVAMATLTDDRGRVAATLSCRPPSGDIIITDYTLEREARRNNTAAVKLGALTVNVPASRERIGRRQALVVPLPQRPPFLAALREEDQLIVTVGARSHAYRAGAAKQMAEIAYACWGS